MKKMIKIKSAKQLDSMREGGKMLREVLLSIGSKVAPGVSTYELDQHAEKLFKPLHEKYGIIPSFKGYKGFPAIICSSINEVVVHGIPSKEDVLQDGDIVKVDCGLFYQGMHTDSCHSFFAGTPEPKLQDLSDTVHKSMMKAIKRVRHGVRLGNIESAVEVTLKNRGYCPIYDCGGHGVGEDLHEQPFISNYGKKGMGPILKKGMVLAIEPIGTLGREKMTYNPNGDGWTLVARDHALTAQWEHTVAVTEDGYEIFT